MIHRHGLGVLAQALALVAGLVVGQAAPTAMAEPADLFVEADFDRAESDVQAQVVYRIRLFQSVSFHEIEFASPSLALAEVQPIAPDRVTESVRTGRRYRVTERQFAVFPYASGELRITDLWVSGTPAGGNPAKKMRLPVPEARLRVRPIPPEFSAAAWVPARSLALAGQWLDDPERAEPGRAIRFSLRVEAVGVDAARVPDLTPAGDGFLAHPDPPRLSRRAFGPWVAGVREQTWRIVPARSGAIEFPEIRVAWWDTVAGTGRTTTLPGRVLQSGDIAVDGAGPSGAVRSGGGVSVAATAGFSAREFLAAAVLGLTLALLASVAVARRPSAWRRVRVACRCGDPAGAQAALLAWAAAGGSRAPPRTLGALAASLADPRARSAVMALDRTLYGPPSGQGWDGRSAYGSLRRCRGALRQSDAEDDAMASPPTA